MLASCHFSFAESSISCLDTGQSACFEPALCVSNQRKSRIPEHVNAKGTTIGVMLLRCRLTRTPLFFLAYAHGIIVLSFIKRLSLQCTSLLCQFNGLM
jgi:hypothetical protein